MKTSELEDKSYEDLVAIAVNRGIEFENDGDRDKIVEILKTLPEKADGNAKYLDEAEPGMIVAFRSKSNKVKSAKIIKKSTKQRKFLLETAYGARSLIDFNDVVWVNTTGRWPRWVYNLMKGIDDNGSQAEA